MTLTLGDQAAILVRIASEADVIQVRQVLREEARKAGFGIVDETKLVTAGSELARNIVTYATGGKGELRVEPVSVGERAGVRAIFSDDGPGIDDVQAALTDGFSTNGSLGLGLPGSKRLVDELTIDTAPGCGTTIVVVKWRR